MFRDQKIESYNVGIKRKERFSDIVLYFLEFSNLRMVYIVILLIRVFNFLEYFMLKNIEFIYDYYTIYYFFIYRIITL